MPRFVIDLGDIEFSREDEIALAADLQKTAMAHVARIQTAEPQAFKFPRDWYGLVMRKSFDLVFETEKQIARGLHDLKIGGVR
jgi:hypothetical protein